MDYTKAFDTVRHSLLFKKLQNGGIPSIVIRLLIHIYTKQTANVRWKTDVSKEFTIQNGVRQGAILSPILFCIYMDDIFKILRKEKTGCYVGPYFAGCYGYADDLLLICPSRTGLQEMLNKVEDYARNHNINFSTNPEPKKSKTKGIIFGGKHPIDPPNLSLMETTYHG